MYRYRGGGEATKWENRHSETFCAPHPQDSGNFLWPPPTFNMAN